MCCVFADKFCIFKAEHTRYIYCPTFIPSYNIFISAFPPFYGTYAEKYFVTRRIIHQANRTSSVSYETVVLRRPRDTAVKMVQ